MVLAITGRRVKMRCPVCGKGRVIDAKDQATAKSIKLCPPDGLDDAQLFAKCGNCGEQIGIAFTPEI